MVKVKIGDDTLISAAEGNGPVNALDVALRKDLGKYQKFIEGLKLIDYRVRILNSGTEAVTRVLIESEDETGEHWTTIGVSPNIIDASFQALMDSIVYKLVRSGAPVVSEVCMIDHVSIAVRDLAACGRFYEAVLAAIGYTKWSCGPRTIGFGKKYPEFWLNERRAMTPVDPDSGTHICLRAPSVEAVQAFHAAAVRAAAPPTARRGRVRNTPPAITRPSCAIPKATRSKR